MRTEQPSPTGPERATPSPEPASRTPGDHSGDRPGATVDPALGWGASLRYRGRTLVDRRVRGPVVVGEDPGCTFVVPDLGPAVTVAVGDTLLGVPGRDGVVFGGAGPVAFAGSRALAPGERAELRLADDITLELRREHYERLPLATLLDARALVRQLVLGAAVVAGLALLVRVETPTNALELRGDPDADPDSALVRAMFVAAAEAPPVPVTYHELYTFPVAPPVPPPPPPTAMPMPILAAAEEAVPVPLAEVDAPVPEKPSRRRRRPVIEELSNTDNVAVLGLLSADHDVFAQLDVVDVLEGGVEGGVVGGVVGDDVLARPADRPIGLRNRGDGLGSALPAYVGTRAGVDVEVEVPTPVESDPPAPVESDMPSRPFGPGTGPGSGHDEPTPTVEIKQLEVPEPQVLPPPATSSGPHSHAADGADTTRGTADGLAAVAGERCEDPSLTRKSQVDVVFVVDVSTTMTFMLDRIEKQIAQVDSEARAQALDPRYGLVVFVDDVLVANGGQPYADIAALQRDLAGWQAFTAGNRQINSAAHNLDWPENTLDAVHAAATQYAWRPADTTLRMVVHATDDDFGEAPAVQSQQTVQHTYRETVDALRAAEVRMFSFAARIGGQCECLDVRAGLYTRFHGQPSLPAATGGAVFDIDEVAAGKLGLAAAVGGAVRSGVCTRYPLFPVAVREPDHVPATPQPPASPRAP